MLISSILQVKTQKQGLAVEKKSIKEKGYISVYLKLLSAGLSYFHSGKLAFICNTYSRYLYVSEL